MQTATIALYSPKGGVGKTSLAVNLAWAAAALSSRRTLLWDLDAQAAASFIMGADPRPRGRAREVIARELPAAELIVPTAVPNLDLLPADDSLRSLDIVLAETGAKKRLDRIAGQLGRHYDRVVVDCPPGLGVTARQVIRGADLIVEPVIPSALSMRAADELSAFVDGRRRQGPAIMRVFNLVDARRSAHREALAAHGDWPTVPMASVIEGMGRHRAPLGTFAPRTAAAKAVEQLWVAIERAIAKPSGKGLA